MNDSKKKPAWKREIDDRIRRGETVWCARGSIAAAYVAWLPGVEQVSSAVDDTVGFRRDIDAGADAYTAALIERHITRPDEPDADDEAERVIEQWKLDDWTAFRKDSR